MTWRLLICSAFICAVALAQEDDEKKVIKSPDGKWEYRVTEEGPVLSKAGETKPVAPLSEEVPGQWAEGATIVWAPDSRRFAFSYRSGGRYETAQIYQLRGEKWVQLRSPEAEEISAPLTRVQDAQLKKLGLPAKTYRRRIWDTWRVLNWPDANTALLYVYSSKTVVLPDDEDPADLSAHFLFTLKFDNAGKWKIIKTHRMSDKEIEEQNAEEERE